MNQKYESEDNDFESPDNLEELNIEIEKELMKLHTDEEEEETEEDLTHQTKKINFEYYMTIILILIVAVNLLFIAYRVIGMFM